MPPSWLEKGHNCEVTRGEASEMNYITAVNGGNTPTWEMGWRDTPCLWYTYVGCRAPSEHPLFEGNTPSWEIWAGGTRQASGTYMWDAGLRASPVRREHTLMGDMGRQDTPCLWYEMLAAGLQASFCRHVWS